MDGIRGHIEVAERVELHSVWSSLYALIAHICEDTASPKRPVIGYIEGAHMMAGRVCDVDPPLIARHRETVGAIEIINEQLNYPVALDATHPGRGSPAVQSFRPRAEGRREGQ